MKDYMDLADDKANIYQKGLLVIVALGIIGGLLFSYFLSQEVTVEPRDYLDPVITYETNAVKMVTYTIATFITNFIFGLVMQFFVDMYKEMVMSRYISYDLFQIFKKEKME